MAYRIEFTTSAAKEFRKLSPEIKKRVAEAVDGLVEEPRPPGTRKLVGHERLYRIRIGQYRVVYEIEDQVLLITVVRVRHRGDVYR